MADEKLHRAARDGHLDLLRAATRKEVNAPDEDGNTPTLLAAQHGNLEALRMIVMRGGDPDRMNLLGSTALHLAARNGFLNCITFLVNYGANVWAVDNDMHSALDMAALANREDIVKFLDDTETIQMTKSPKIVQTLKEKSIAAAEKNAKHYEKVQEKAAKDLARSRRHMEKMENAQSHQNGDFKPPSEKSFFKKLTLRMKGTSKLSTMNGSSQQFSDVVQGGRKGRGSHKLTQKKMSLDNSAMMDFKTSETDEEGKRTLRSMRVTGVQKDGQVLYTTEKSNPETSGVRPALAGVFPGTSLSSNNWNKSRSDPNLLDSGIESIDSNQNDDDEESAPGVFNRPQFGQISFLNRMDHGSFAPSLSAYNPPDDGVDGGVANGNLSNGVLSKRSSGADSDSIGAGDSVDLPWKEEEVLTSGDEEEDEFTPVVLFLEACGLLHYTHLFTNAEVDMAALMLLTSADFQEMGLPIGPRRKLMDAIQRRRDIVEKPGVMGDTHL